MHNFTIAIVGNPNVGKSTLFNRLTGGAQKIGNWPGKTIEIKEGFFKKAKHRVKIVDLPGIYSLNSNSPEEIVTNDFIHKKNPDLIIQIADSTNLKRNLYLTTQLLDITNNVFLVLNFSDIAKAKKILINTESISKILDINVLKISARNGDGIDELMKKALNFKPNKNKKTTLTTPLNAKQRYALISKIAENSIHMPSKIGKKSQFLDNILTHRFLGLPIFILIMFAVFQFTFTVAEPFANILDIFFSYLSDSALILTHELMLPTWFGSLLANGIISGIGGILVFLPNILILFFLLSILEDFGYFARIAVIMDSLMQKIGLDGKAFIPLILGFGCNVPAIMATRIIEDENERLITILINPLMSCSARLPIYILFTAIFFVKYQALVLLFLYLFGVVLAILVAFLIKRLVLKKTSPPALLIELPPYRIPTFSTIIKNTYEKAMVFVKKAGYIILSVSIFIWFLASMPFGVQYASEQSLIGQVGNFIAPVFAPAGFGNWKATVSLIFGSMAKEIVVSTLATLYGAEGGTLNTILANHFTPLSSLAFMLFSLIYMPCIATMVTIRNETGSIKWMFFAIGYMLILAWLIAVAVYQIGLFLGFN